MKPWNPPSQAPLSEGSFPSTIGGINRLPVEGKRAVYARVIPPSLLKKFEIRPEMRDDQGRDLFELNCPAGHTNAEISLYHQHDFPDPVLYGHITDTINAQIHILFYVMNDPYSPRYDIDRLPDGRPTQLGSKFRNIDAEIEAMEAGLSPGQIRKGPHMLRDAMETFEAFIQSLDHDLHFAEPLYYHNAVIFENYGFAYQRGRRLMQRIQQGFELDGDLLPLLDGSTPFRQPHAAGSIRLRSWAIHDGILGQPFQNVTMYKHVGQHANLSTCSGCGW
jgi:hypothetical protein